MGAKKAGEAVALTVVPGLAPGLPRALAGRYRLVRLLAKGGMAEVWEGRDEVLNRPVAVKMLLAHLAADPYLQERFRREAVTAARLVHPGIVAIFDAGVEVVGEPGGGPEAMLSVGWPRDDRPRPESVAPDQPSTAFIVMELVPGETLRDLIARAAPLSPQLATAIAAQVADALAYAHAQGLVHRDIKPANVLLRDEGPDVVRVKVADFGIAKAAATAGGDLTASGTVLGTPKYLSPEQVQGKEPDPRADLYSLGVVLFEMLAGRPPFQENTDMATALAQVQKAVPPLGELVPGLPEPLTDLVAALLAKDPARRVPSALVLGSALANVRRALGGSEALPEPGANLHTGALPSQPGAPGAGAPHSGPAGESGTITLDDGAPGTSTVVDRASGLTLVDQAAASEHARVSGRRRRAPGRAPRKAVAGKAARRHRRRPGRWTSAVVVTLLLAGVVLAAVLVHTPGTAPGTGTGGAGGGAAGPARAPSRRLASSRSASSLKTGTSPMTTSVSCPM